MLGCMHDNLCMLKALHASPQSGIIPIPGSRITHLEAGAWLREAGRGSLRGHAGAHCLGGPLWLGQRRKGQRLGQSLEDGAWLGEATCKHRLLCHFLS